MSLLTASLREAARLSRRYAVRNMTATVDIYRGGAVDDHGNVSMPTDATVAAAIYSGPARVYSLASGGSTQLGEMTQFLASSYVSIPTTATPTQADDLIRVSAHDDDDVVGRWFRVMAIDGGGQFPVVRRHTVVGVSPSPALPQPLPMPNIPHPESLPW